MKPPKLLFKVGGVLFGAFYLAILLWFGNELRMAVVTGNWTPISAKVLRSEIVERQQPARGRYGTPPKTKRTIEITYTYTVDGRTYSSSRYSLTGKLNAANRAHAEQLRSPYLAGSDTVAYYDPNDPGRSVLVAGWRGISWAAASLGGGSTGLALAASIRIIWEKWAGKGKKRRRAIGILRA